MQIATQIVHLNKPDGIFPKTYCGLPRTDNLHITVHSQFFLHGKVGGEGFMSCADCWAAKQGYQHPALTEDVLNPPACPCWATPERYNGGYCADCESGATGEVDTDEFDLWCASKHMAEAFKARERAFYAAA